MLLELLGELVSSGKAAKSHKVRHCPQYLPGHGWVGCNLLNKSFLKLFKLSHFEVTMAI
jgi:hypothetical protein